MSTINRQPLGLLGFLGIKNGGVNPQRLGSELAPVWDLAELYLQSNAQYATTGLIATPAAGGLSIFTVPQTGQLWYVSGFSIFMNTQAASTLVVNLARFSQGNTATIMVGPTVTLAALQATQLYLADPIWLQPGDSIGASLAVKTGNGQYTAAIRYTVLDV